MGKTRSAGIGKGNKMAFSDTEKVPSPGNYNIKSHFDQNQKGIKFSLGREV